MKHFDLNWTNVLARLPTWSKLSVGGRRVALDAIKPNGGAPISELRAVLPELVEAGLVSVGQARATLAEPTGELFRALLAMDRQRDLFAKPSIAALAGYLEFHFVSNEIAAIGSGVSSGYAYAWVDRQRVAQHVATVDWVENFLALKGKAEAKAWEDPRRSGSGAQLLVAGTVFEVAQKLVETVVRHREGLPLSDIVAAFPGVSSSDLGRAVHASLRYALCYAILDPTTLDPRIGTWPAISDRLTQPPPTAPLPVEPVETFQAAYLMEDMTAVLVAAAGEPLRLRGNDFEIFARQRQAIASRITEMPDWVTTFLQIVPDERISVAADQLRAQKLTKPSGTAGQTLRLEPSKTGRKWLGMNDRDRLASILDPWRSSPERNPERWYESRAETAFFPRPLGFDVSREGIDLRDALNTAFLSLQGDAFFRLDEFLEFHSRERNPFLVTKDGRRQAPAAPRFAGSRPTSRDGWERLWTDVLASVLWFRLVPSGGARLGRGGDGRISFQITDIGRYLLGAASTFDYGHDVEADVIVQPNFEIVFLARAPQLEARLSRVAGRLGSGPGVMFRITRESILAAAQTGLSLELVFETLRDASSRPLPANVERQIRDWFGGVRRIVLSRPLLIRCPDPETAARVGAAAGGSARFLTDTCLEVLADQESIKALVRKLRKDGVFVDG